MDGSRLQYGVHDNLMEPLHRDPSDSEQNCWLFGAVARPTERLGTHASRRCTGLITPKECKGMVLMPWCGVGLRVAARVRQYKTVLVHDRHRCAADCES